VRIAAKVENAVFSFWCIPPLRFALAKENGVVADLVAPVPDLTRRSPKYQWFPVA
jgi:hypothetical protein